jgi:hypothetical protein
MKTIFQTRFKTALFILILFLSSIMQAQTFTIDTILYNGNPNKFLNIVFLGDGYQTPELSKYIEDVTESSNYLFTVDPFMQYQNYFNVFAVRVNSNESGADHPRTAQDCPPASSHPAANVDTYFNATFDYYSIHRLLVATNNSAVNSAIINNFPLYDQVIMLVNTEYYGGSGGWVATSSTNQASNEIVVHEIGHSFADLADEYWAGDVYAAEKANMTQESNPDVVKWKNWLGYNNVGIYPYGTSGNQSQWFRPHQNCKMRALNNPFCPVCQEAITLRIIEQFQTPIHSHLPEELSVSLTEDSIQFSLQMYTPTPNTIRTKWILNDELLATHTDSISIASSQLLSGENILIAEVLDTTELIRAEHHPFQNTFTVQWTINNQLTDSKLYDKSSVKIYPNPVSQELIIEIEGNTSNSSFEIVNVSGQSVYKGNIIQKSIVQTESFAPGVYFLRLENGAKFEFTKIVVP